MFLYLILAIISDSSTGNILRQRLLFISPVICGRKAVEGPVRRGEGFGGGGQRPDLPGWDRDSLKVREKPLEIWGRRGM